MGKQLLKLAAGCVTLIIIFCCTGTVTVYPESIGRVTAGGEAGGSGIEPENGGITEEEVKVALGIVSCLRESLFTSEPCAGRSISNLYFEKIVYDDIRERYLDLRQLEEKMKCVFLSAATSFYVNKIDYSGCLATVSAYEWNEIQYRCQGYDETDRMGFGSHHLLVFEKGDNGIIHILQDSFDERTSVGFHSSDLECQEHVFLIADGVADRMILSGGNTTYSGYNASAAVAYANTWCGVSAANTNSGTIHPENYNPDY